MVDRNNWSSCYVRFNFGKRSTRLYCWSLLSWKHWIIAVVLGLVVGYVLATALNQGPAREVVEEVVGEVDDSTDAN